MIHVKEGVRFAVLRPQIWSILGMIDQIFTFHGERCTITCGTDGHPDDDPHSHGFAIDLRTKGVRDPQQLHMEIEHALGEEYFVQYESPGTDKEHIHVQYRKDLWHAVIAKEKANGNAEMA